MLQNYIKIAFRQLKNQKMYSAIKIGGFALSIAACILITLYIRDELSYDRHYANGDRLFRVVGAYNNEGDIQKGTSFPSPMAKALMTDFPQVEEAGRLMPNSLFYGAGSNEIKREDQVQNTYEEGFTYADQGLMDILKIPLIYGNPAHLLDDPNTMVITQRKADKYFPHQNPIGKIFYLNNDKAHPYKVTGVIGDFASTSHLHYDFFLSMKGAVFFPGEDAFWGANNHDTYVLLRPGVDPKAFKAKMAPAIIHKYMVPAMQAYGNKDAESIAKNMDLELQPVGDIYLKSYEIHDSLPVHGDIRFVWMFGGIACFILFIACINFINLSTAKSAGRAKEVGLRKVVGSYRSSLIQQFLAESMIYSLLSFVLALVLAWMLLPYFNRLSSKSLTLPTEEWWFLPSLLISAGLVGLAAGLYPAFYLSDFKPIQVLKGQVARGARNSTLRSVLVIFQFTTSIILIIGTFAIYRQMQFIMNKNVGFDKDQVLLIQGTNTMGDDDVRAFKNELLKLSQVKSVSIGDYLPVGGSKRNGNSFYKDGKAQEEKPYFAQFWIADYDYIETMGMHLLEGRNFSKDMASDTAATIINQTFAKKLGLGDHPVGQIIMHYGQKLRVIGVLKDFNFESFRDDIDGVSLFLGLSPSVVSVKMKTADVGNILPQVTALWKKMAPDQPLRYTFMDDSFKNMYADVQKQASIFTSFATLAIIIACLGLFALSAFMAEQRSKEVSIRKVLGASVTELTSLLSRDFVKLVLIALVIASPIAWWGMNKWLQNFIFRIEIHWWFFAIAGLLVIVIALATISFQAIKAAMVNPIKNLRSE